MSEKNPGELTLEDQRRKAQQGPRKLGRRGKGGGMTPKENNLIPIYIITSDGKEHKITGNKFFEMKAKGGRVGFPVTIPLSSKLSLRILSVSSAFTFHC